MKNLFIIIISIVLFAAAVSGIISYSQLKQERIELSSIEKRIESVKKQIDQTKEKIVTLEQQNKLFQQEIAESENQIDTYNSQVSELRNKKEQVIYKLQNKRIQLTSLKEEQEGLIKDRDSLKSKLNEMIRERQYADDEIAKLSNAKRNLEEDIKKYIKPGKGIELEKIIVKLSEVSDGSILEIDDKYGFAIIDVGSENGIIVGDILGVYRDNILISRVVVEKVFADMSSVVPAAGFTNVDLMASDEVKRIAPFGKAKGQVSP